MLQIRLIILLFILVIQQQLILTVVAAVNASLTMPPPINMQSYQNNQTNQNNSTKISTQFNPTLITANNLTNFTASDNSSVAASAQSNLDDDDDDDYFSEESNEEISTIRTPITSTTTTITTTTTASSSSLKQLLQKIITPKITTNSKRFNKIVKKGDIIETISLPIGQDTTEWKCPNITSSRSLECTCDLPHTLRCNGDIHGLSVLTNNLRDSPYSVSLLDCSLKNVTTLNEARIFENISLHGLVISSGEIKRVHKSAFIDLKKSLLALGLPGNAFLSVPWNSIAPLSLLERLDLSNNRIKALGITDFSSLRNLNFLDLSNNQISSIALRTFMNLKQLDILKLNGNRLGDFPLSLKAIGQCFHLRQLDLKSNSISGPLTDKTLPTLRNLDTLNLERNLIKSIQNKALKNFTKLLSLSLRHNQIDVLQDHAFYGLGSLEILDLSYNGIVAISSSSLQHLSRLHVLDLTHNFLRALTSDLIVPLPSLKELRLAGNDISIIAKNALDGATELIHLSLQENPLSCDCSIRSFSIWLQEQSKIIGSDLLSATCVTPPRLEGAPLIQVPIETLNCDQQQQQQQPLDGDDNLEQDNLNIIQQLKVLTTENISSSASASSFVHDLSDKILLRDFHFSTDYGLILTWTLNFSQDDYMCDAIFVYKEENINEILIDNSPIHCESKLINGQNTVSVIVPDSSALDIGESYRFCLVLVHQINIKSDLVVGCSNITKLQLNNEMDHENRFLPSSASSSSVNRRSFGGLVQSDISSFDRISTHSDEISSNSKIDDLIPNKSLIAPTTHGTSSSFSRKFKIQDHTDIHQSKHTYDDLFNTLNKSFFPGLGLGILVTSIFILIWGATRIRNNHHHSNHNNSRSNSPATTCYAASDCGGSGNGDRHLTDSENGNRYLKLQATSSL